MNRQLGTKCTSIKGQSAKGNTRSTAGEYARGQLRSDGIVKRNDNASCGGASGNVENNITVRG